MTKKRATFYSIFILLSVALHILIFYSLIGFNDLVFMSELKHRLDHKIVDRTKDLEVQIELVDASEKQIVEQSTTSINEVEPEETKFLSAKNQDVEKETKARVTGAFKNTRPKAATFSVSQSEQSQATVSQAPQVSQQKISEIPDADLGISGLKPAFNAHMVAQDAVAAKRSQGQAASESPADLSQTDDYLENIDEGEFTLLKTREFKYWSFYSRVKDQLRSHWNPLIRNEVSFIYSTGRSLASVGKKRTSLRVTLDQDGYLEEVALVRTSGNQKIDHAAIQAFRLAAPFPRPPKGMLEKDRKIRIFWDFVLET